MGERRCGRCGSAAFADGLCAECAFPEGVAVDTIQYGDVVWAQGELPTHDMRRRLTRKLQTELRLVEQWERAAVVAEPVALPAPVVAAAPVVPVPEAPPRFVIEPFVRVAAPKVAAPPAPLVSENFGWWVGGFLLFAGMVFLAGTFWGALPATVQVAVEIALIGAFSTSLARGGAALVGRGVSIGRGLAAVGLSLSLVGSVVVAVEGRSWTGWIATALVGLTAAGVSRAARRADLVAVPAWSWPALTLFPALAWLVPALAWPALAGSMFATAAVVRAALLDRRAERGAGVVAAAMLGLGAATIAVSATTGAAVGWVLAPFGGALAIWFDAARSRWRGVEAPAFARPLPVVGTAVALAGTTGLVSASVWGGGAAFVGGCASLALLALVGRRHPERFLPVTTSAAALFVPAALLGALGVQSDGNPAGWFACAAFAAPVVAWVYRGTVDVRRLLTLVAGLAVVPVAAGGGVTGAVAGVGWAAVAGVIAYTLAEPWAAAVAVSLVAATWVSPWSLPDDAGPLVLGWSAVILLATRVARALRRRATGDAHPAVRVAWAFDACALALAAVSLHTLVLVGGVGLATGDTPPGWLLAASLALAGAFALPAAERREEALTWAALAPLAFAGALVRPTLGWPGDLAVGVAVCAVATTAIGWAVSRLDRAPWNLFGKAAQGSTDGPAGWLASPVWRTAQVATLAVAASAGVERVLGHEGRTLIFAIGGPLLAVAQARLDARPLASWVGAAAALCGGAVLCTVAPDAPAPVVVGLTLAGVAFASGRVLRGPAGLAAATGTSTLLAAWASLRLVDTGWPGVPEGAMFAAASAPLLTAAFVSSAAFSWPAVALLGASVVTFAFPYARGPLEWGLTAAVAACAGAVVAAVLGRVDRGAVSEALRAGSALAAAAASAALLVAAPTAREAIGPHAAALAAWSVLALSAWTSPRTSDLTDPARIGVLAFVALELGWVAHLGARVVVDAPELGATALSALVAAAVAARGVGAATRTLREPASASPWALLAVWTAGLGAAPALYAAVSPDPVGSSAAVAWGVAAAFAFGAPWTALVSVVAAAALAVDLQGPLGLAGVAAVVAWVAAGARRLSSGDPELPDLAARFHQVLVPAAAVAGAAAVVIGGVSGAPLAPIVAVVALGALGPVPDGFRAPIATLTPALVATLAEVPLPVSAGLASGGAVALAGWSALTRAPFVPLAVVAAAVGVTVGALGTPATVQAGTWVALAATIAPFLRTRGAELALPGVAASLAAAGAALLLPATGVWVVLPCAAVALVGWAVAAARLSVPSRGPDVAALAVVAASWVVVPDHRAAGVVAAVFAAAVLGSSWWRTPSVASAAAVAVASFGALAGLRVGAPLSVWDPFLVLGLAAALVPVGDLLARLDGERGTSAADVARWAAVGMPAAGLALAVVAPGSLGPAACATAAAAWAVTHARRRDVPSLLLMFGAINLAVVTGLLRANQWDPTLYVLPFAASAAALSHHFRTRLAAPALEAIRWSAAGVLYATALARLLVTADNILPAVLVGLLGLVAGVALRVRPWITSAAAFLVSVVCLQAMRFGIAHQMGLGVVLSLAGVAVLGTTVFVTLRRQRLGAASPAPSDDEDAALALPPPAAEPDPDAAGPRAPESAIPARAAAPPPSVPPAGT